MNLGETIATVGITAVISVLIATNDFDYSQPNEHIVAEHVCSKNGGYIKYGYSIFRSYVYYCNDSAIFRLKFSQYVNMRKSLLGEDVNLHSPSDE